MAALLKDSDYEIIEQEIRVKNDIHPFLLDKIKIHHSYPFKVYYHNIQILILDKDHKCYKNQLDKIIHYHSNDLLNDKYVKLTFDTCDYIIYVIADAISKTRDCSFHKAPNNVILGFAFLSVNNFDLFSRKNKNKWYYTCLHDITLHPNNSDNQNVYYNTNRDKHHDVHHDIHHVLVIDTMATRLFLGKEILHAIEFLAIQKNCQMVAANSIEKSMHYYLRNGFLHTLDWVTFSPWLYNRKMYYVGSKKMNNKKYYSFMYPFMNKVYTFTKPVGDKHNIDVSDAKSRLKKYNYKKGRFITRHLKICFPKLKKQRDSIDSINSSKSTAKSTSHGSITSLSS